MSSDLRLFSSVRLEQGKCTLLPLHLDLLEHSARVLSFALNRSLLEAEIAGIAAEHTDPTPARLRFTLAVNGSRTFDPVDTLLPDAEGLQALLWDEPIDARNPLLAHKTTHRPVYDRAVRRAHSCGYIDALFCNQEGFVTEGAVHSIFVRHGERWRTPRVEAGILPGVFRRHLLDTTPGIREENFRREDLLSADEVWLTNAVRGIRRVTCKAS